MLSGRAISCVRAVRGGLRPSKFMARCAFYKGCRALAAPMSNLAALAAGRVLFPKVPLRVPMHLAFCAARYVYVVSDF
ncbi:hypothetical protein EVAR_103862_1 [Eumeta japonica]|uniref:Uncharacterized protein n=1 Tax=Eumeta variegata TaxID=151549 RepID=A0A4C2ADS3_EUMVA|nr:hypothetical protein EVAR_103862_1 [Eumeta japonica]